MMPESQAERARRAMRERLAPLRGRGRLVDTQSVQPRGHWRAPNRLVEAVVRTSRHTGALVTDMKRIIRCNAIARRLLHGLYSGVVEALDDAEAMLDEVHP